jgi:hypothetical protein
MESHWSRISGLPKLNKEDRIAVASSNGQSGFNLRINRDWRLVIDRGINFDWKNPLEKYTLFGM